MVNVLMFDTMVNLCLPWFNYSNHVFFYESLGKTVEHLFYSIDVIVQKLQKNNKRQEVSAVYYNVSV